MSTRSKLRKLLHRDKHHDEPQSPQSAASTSSPTQPFRYEIAPQGESPRIGQRPLSGTGPVSPSLADARPRKSLDRKSLDMQTLANASPTPNSRDRQAPVLPPVPSVDHSFDTPAVPQHNGDASHKRNVSSDNRSSGAPPNFSQPLSLRQGRHSEDVADWNIVQSREIKSPDAVPAPLNVSKRSGEQTRNATKHTETPGSQTYPNGSNGMARGPPAPQSDFPGSQSYPDSSSPESGRRSSISRKPLAGGSTVRMVDAPVGNNAGESLSTTKQNRASLDKPLPGRPAPEPTIVEDMALSKVLPEAHQYVVKDAPSAPSLVGIVDLNNTVDTTVEETWAPAITHETVEREEHHIREERITREIHYHDVYHRILPIIDIEVLPARHYVRNDDGTLREICEDEIPGTSQYKQEWFVAEALSKIPTGGMPPGPRQFTAKEFVGNEGDYKEYISDKGIPTTETTWVHPPTVATASFLNGKTTPFHLGSPDPAHDGFRGPCYPVSNLFWRQGQPSPAETMSNGSPTHASSRSGVRGSGPLTPPGTAGRAGIESKLFI